MTPAIRTSIALRTWIILALVTLAGSAGAAPASVGYQSARNGRVAAFFAAALEVK